MSNSALAHRVLVAASVFNLAAIWLAPAMVPDSLVCIGQRIAYSAVCHQREDRTLRLDGVPMPVCSRCAAIYTGLTAGLLLPLICAPRRRAIALGLLLVAVEIAGEKTGFSASNLTRFLASLPLALMVGASVRRALAGGIQTTGSADSLFINTAIESRLKEGSTP
ncbi:MAG: DUF2085 domain-containing protein [Acidobacteriota bacterium]